MGRTARLKILSPLFCLFLGLDSWGKNSSLLSSEELFSKLKGFVSTLPSSFIAEVSSEEIRRDIQKIPRIYIKDAHVRPKLLLLFSREWGIKVYMDNVARGISKQYSTLGEGFSAFLPFLKAQSYSDFQKDFTLTGRSYTRIQIHDTANTKNLLYVFDMDPINGRIQSIRQEIDGRIGVIMRFFYKVRENSVLINQLLVDRLIPAKEHYQFLIFDYNLHPSFTRKDFLG